MAVSIKDRLALYPNITVGPGGNKHRCVIYLTITRAGMFANFYRLLYGIYLCAKEEIKPILVIGESPDFNAWLANGEPNIFEFYFEQKIKLPAKTGIGELPVMTVTAPAIFLKWCRVSQREKNMAHLIISEFFVLRKDVANRLKHFTNTHFAKHKVLGVHYRGRDKVTESPVLDFEAYDQRIAALLSDGLFDKVFFCTDEIHLKERLVEKYGDRIVTYALRADYTLHTANAGNLEKGLHFDHPTPFLQWDDAIMECYLLAGCHALMGSSTSSFTLFATFIRPLLPHIVLNA